MVWCFLADIKSQAWRRGRRSRSRSPGVPATRPCSTRCSVHWVHDIKSITGSNISSAPKEDKLKTKHTVLSSVGKDPKQNFNSFPYQAKTNHPNPGFWQPKHTHKTKRRPQKHTKKQDTRETTVTPDTNSAGGVSGFRSSLRLTTPSGLCKVNIT